MAQVNPKNERLKRQFFGFLKEAEGRAEATINAVDKAICLYEEFSGYESFALTSEKASQFKAWLRRRTHRGKPLSLATYHAYLRHLRRFFIWLSAQPGYKSRITSNAVAYLNISLKEERMATQQTPRNYPSLEYVVQLASSITDDSEVGRRDQALIAFTFLSGMRDSAVASLPLGCFDENTLQLTQDPRLGVQTKFAKYIPTTLLPLDQRLIEYLLTWVRYLKHKGFGSQDPLFPRSKPDQGKDGLAFETPTEVERAYWRGTGSIRTIFRRRAEAANLPYYPPHTFRHAMFHEALKYCRDGQQMRALSQNLGHEHLATSLAHYSNLTPQQLHEILSNMDFSTKEPQDDEKLRAVKKLLDEYYKTL